VYEHIEAWDERVEHVLVALRAAAPDLEAAVGHDLTVQKGMLRPAQVGTPLAISVRRTGMDAYEFTTGVGPIEVAMDLEVELYTRQVGDPEALEATANRLSAAVHDLLQSLKNDHEYWWRLRLEGGDVSGRTTTRQDYVLETIPMRVWFDVTQ